MDYKYEIFISYPSSDSNIKEWVEGIFYSLLREELYTELGCRNPEIEPSIFIQSESIQTGQKWEKLITEGLHYTKCIIPILSPTYFSSPWCCREIATLIKRAELLDKINPSCQNSQIILPVLFKKRNTFVIPQKITNTYHIDGDFYKYTYTYDKKSEGFRILKQKIRTWVEDILGPAIKKAPKWENSFIMTCYDPKLDTEDIAVSDPAIRDYYVPKSSIPKPSMS